MIFVIVAEQTIISVTTGVNTRVNINTNQPTVQSSLRPRSSKIYFTFRKFIEFCLNSVAFNPISFSLPLSFYSRFRSHFSCSILSRIFLINDKIPSVPGWLVVVLVVGVTANNCFSVSFSFQPEETNRHSREGEIKNERNQKYSLQYRQVSTYSHSAVSIICNVCHH